LEKVQNAEKRQQAPPLHRCKSRNKRGEPCQATIVGHGGFCTAHDPERKVDMRALGSKGGKGRRRGVGERLPASERESLREALRGLDPEKVKAAVEQSLAGGNESARVSAVRLLADLEPFRDGCPACAEREREASAVAEQAELKLGGLVVACIRAILVGDLETAPGFARIAADQLDDDLRARIAELR
jgi:hypothetical protein